MSGLEITRLSRTVLVAAHWHAPYLISKVRSLKAEGFWT